jgi:hypothetical protein
MAIKLIQNYQAWWDSSAGEGYFWFTYFDGERQRTGAVSQDSFRIVNDILRNEKPVYGDHTRAMVTTQSEEVGEEETENSG